MKVAIATDQNMVSGHFGHCEGFTIYELEGNIIKEKTFSLNPGHQPGYLTKRLTTFRCGEKK
jgi:predicted Fe-Mo cluster-binding NifX family protein